MALHGPLVDKNPLISGLATGGHGPLWDKNCKFVSEAIAEAVRCLDEGDVEQARAVLLQRLSQKEEEE